MRENDALTLDQLIERLKAIRETEGGNVPVYHADDGMDRPVTDVGVYREEPRGDLPFRVMLHTTWTTDRPRVPARS